MKGIICSFDWIPSSGSLKLLEINTNVLLGGMHQIENFLSFDGLATYCNSNEISEVKLHHNYGSWQGYDFDGNPIESISQEVQSKVSSSLAIHNISSSLYLDVKDYPLGMTEVGTDDILDLRVGTSGNSKLDYMAIKKDNLREFINQIGSGSLMAETGSEQIQSHNSSGIPDYLWKISTRDQHLGIAFYESSSYSSSIDNSLLPSGNRQDMATSFIEKYYTPDNDKWGYFNEIHYIVALMEDGTVLPLSINSDNPFVCSSFSRKSFSDYSNKDLKLKSKIVSFGLCGENTNIKLADNSTNTPIQIHISSSNLDLVDVKTVKIDSLDLNSYAYNTVDSRLGYYTSYTGSFNFVSGSNNYTLIPKYCDNCYDVDGTVLHGNTLMPIKSGSSWEIKKVSTVQNGDVYLNSNLSDATISSVSTTTDQVLVYPQPQSDLPYQRSLFCDDKLVLSENHLYTLNEPQASHISSSLSGSDCFTQEMNLLSHNITNGVRFNYSDYSSSVYNYTKNILDQLGNVYSSSVWDW